MPNVQLFVRDSTNNKNVALQVDGSNKLSVNDATAQSSLSSINSALGGTLTVSDSTAQSSLSSINLALGGTLTTSNLTAEGSLSNIASSVAGTLAVSDSTAQSTLSNIHTALSGTLTTSSGVSRTNGNIAVAASVSNGDVSSAVDANNFKNAMVMGNLGASGDIVIQYSNDSTNWYEDSNSSYFSNYSTYDVVGKFSCESRYWRIKYNISSTVTVRYALMA